MRIEINIHDRHVLIILLFITVVSAIGLVVAYGGIQPSVMGHTWGEMYCDKCIINSNLADNSVSGAKLGCDSTLCRNAINGNIGIGTTSPSQKLEVNGGIMLNTSSVKPACNAGIRGTIWYEKGTTEADKIYVCSGSLSQVCCTAAAGSPCTVTCSGGGVIKSIDDVSYGTDSSWCTNNPQPSCPDGSAYKCTSTPSSCIGQPSCTFTFSDAVCGNPCWAGGNKKGMLKVTCTIPSTFSWNVLGEGQAGLGSQIPPSTLCGATTLPFNKFTIYQNRWAAEYTAGCPCDTSSPYRYYFGSSEWSSCISVNCGACAPFIP